MHFLLDLLQGAGIAAAVGIRPFLPVLLVGALAAGNLGVDFGGTGFSFLESVPFLVVILVLVAAGGILLRRVGPESSERGPISIALLSVAVVLGALEASGSLDDRSATWWPGIPVGAAAAALGFFAARSLFSRVRRRLDAQTAGALPLYAEAAALIAAGVSVLLPPLALLVIGGLAWLLAGSRRREGEKYAGLRILR